jgi:ketosteroid isomerase-like protein
MSQENVELVRRMYALADQGDETIWDLIPPEFDFDFSRRLIDPVVARGRDQARAWCTNVWNVWTFRDGKPVEWTYFGEDKAEALEAAGLSE